MFSFYAWACLGNVPAVEIPSLNRSAFLLGAATKVPSCALDIFQPRALEKLRAPFVFGTWAIF